MKNFQGKLLNSKKAFHAGKNQAASQNTKEDEEKTNDSQEHENNIQTHNRDTAKRTFESDKRPDTEKKVSEVATVEVTTIGDVAKFVAAEMLRLRDELLPKKPNQNETPNNVQTGTQNNGQGYRRRGGRNRNNGDGRGNRNCGNGQPQAPRDKQSLQNFQNDPNQQNLPPREFNANQNNFGGNRNSIGNRGNWRGGYGGNWGGGRGGGGCGRGYNTDYNNGSHVTEG